MCPALSTVIIGIITVDEFASEPTVPANIPLISLWVIVVVPLAIAVLDKYPVAKRLVSPTSIVTNDLPPEERVALPLEVTEVKILLALGKILKYFPWVIKYPSSVKAIDLNIEPVSVALVICSVV